MKPTNDKQATSTTQRLAAKLRERRQKLAIQELTPRLSQILGVKSPKLRFLDIETIDEIRYGIKKSTSTVRSIILRDIIQREAEILISQHKVNSVGDAEAYIFLGIFEDAVFTFNIIDIMDKLIILSDNFELLTLFDMNCKFYFLIDKNDGLYDIEAGEV